MWQSISICFVRSWKVGFVAMCCADWLSQYSCAGEMKGSSISCNIYVSHCNSQTVVASARYSASDKDLDTGTLFLGLPWNQGVTKENAVANCGAPCVHSTSPIWVWESLQWRSGVCWIKQTMSRNVLNILQDSDSNLLVQGGWSTHVLTQLLDSKAEVWSCCGEVK